MTEPLKPLLEIYNNKLDVFNLFLSQETTKYLKNVIYHPDIEDLFINMRLILVNKDTGIFHKKGNLVCINVPYITIKVGDRHLKYSIEDYYIFENPRVNKSNSIEKEFLKDLLKIL